MVEVIIYVPRHERRVCPDGVIHGLEKGCILYLDNLINLIPTLSSWRTRERSAQNVSVACHPPTSVLCLQLVYYTN